MCICASIQSSSLIDGQTAGCLKVQKSAVSLKIILVTVPCVTWTIYRTQLPNSQRSYCSSWELLYYPTFYKNVSWGNSGLFKRALSKSLLAPAPTLSNRRFLDFPLPSYGQCQFQRTSFQYGASLIDTTQYPFLMHIWHCCLIMVRW